MSACVFIFVAVCLILVFPRIRKWYTSKPGLIRVAFIHPYCNAGGGGERVLWCWIRALHTQYPASNLQCVVYTGDNVALEKLLHNVLDRFNIEIEKDRVELVRLSSRWLVEAKTWPRFTLLGQSASSMIMGLEACYRYTPDVVIDSMGYAFCVAVFKWFTGCKTCSYVHYPTISTDMINVVETGTAAFNNSSQISSSTFLRKAKLIYYKFFASLYGIMGKHSDVVLTNSTWTNSHILQIWKQPSKTAIVYPPCDLKNFLSLKLQRETKPFYFVSVAQFRPEKNHALQVHAFKRLLEILPKDVSDDIFLDIVGSVRHSDDDEILQSVKKIASQKGIEDKVLFSTNVSFEVLRGKLQRSVGGLHTMWNEHFGIGIVEMMASGCIVIAHNSGGPRMDIVSTTSEDSTPSHISTTTRTGFLADSVDTYAECMKQVVLMGSEERHEIANSARQSITRFSEHAFEQSVLKYLLNSHILHFD